MPVGTRIQLRRGDAADWTDANPTLSAGELGLELDTGQFKIGDGTTAWNDLGYVVAFAPHDRDPEDGLSAVWALELTGSPDGGTFTLLITVGDADPVETGPIDWDEVNVDDPNPSLQTILDAALGAGTTTTGGGPLPALITIEFGAGSLARTVIDIEVGDNSLTGGTDPAPSLNQTQVGISADGLPEGAGWWNDDEGTAWVNNGDESEPVWMQIGALGDNVLVSGSLVASNEFGSASLQTQGTGGLVQANVMVIQGVTDGTASYLVSVQRGAVTAGDPGGDSWGVKLHGHEYLIGLDAIDDGDVATSERVQWFDDTEDAPTARFKERDSAGNLRSGRAASLTDDGSAFQGVDKVSLTVGDAAEIMAALVTLGLATDDT